MLLELLLICVVLVYLVYKWGTLKYEVFNERGVPFERPLPLVGNLGSVLTNSKSFAKLFLEFYQRNKHNKITGFFNFREPAFVLAEPEFIKKITVKDFDHFPNHYLFIDTEHDKLLKGMLNVMKDQRWKDMRNTLTPAFTAAKMRAMFSLMNECFDESLQYLRSQSKSEEGFVLELKECFTRLSNDIIASTAFGLKVNSYVDRRNTFYTVGQTITSLRGGQLFKFLCGAVAPKLTNFLGIKVFEVEKTNYFLHLVMDTMKYREEHNIVRPDMIQLLMEAKKESAQHWSDEDIVSQCFLFFFAAFENNANFISITCYELAQNPDVQKQLYEEAQQIRDDLNGSALDYDVLSKMKYLDMILSESLRKWPLAAFTDRVCTKDYTLTDEDGIYVFDFKQGDRIFIPIIGIQRDEKYFTNPDVFDPERFCEANKGDILPFTYLPFGVGPRNCIGNRYALMQAKAMLYHLVLNFKIESCSKTVPNLMDDARGFQINPRSGIWLRFVERRLIN